MIWQKIVTRFKDATFSVVAALAFVAVFAVLYRIVPVSLIESLGDKEVELFYADHISAAHTKVIEAFNKEYAGKIKVIPVDISFSKFTTNERKQLFIRYLRSESARIDLFSIDQIWIPRFSKWCTPLDSLLAVEKNKQIIPVALQAATYNGKLIAIPQFFDLGVLYYRRDKVKQFPDLFQAFEKKQPITWEAIINSVRGHSKDMFLFQGENYEGLMCMFTEVYLGMGGQFRLQDRRILQEATAVKAIEFLHALLYTHKIAPEAVLGFDENSSSDYFERSNAGMIRIWPSGGMKLIREQNTRNNNAGISYTQMPGFTGHKPVTVMGGWNLMISKYSEHKQEALAFVKFWLSRASQEVLHKDGGYIPVSTEIYNDSTYLRQYPELQFYRSIFPLVVQRPSLPLYTKFSDIVTRYLHKALKNELTPAAAVEHINTETEHLNGEQE